MLKVVIADDEKPICRLVQMLADWDALGMELAGTASNGLEALELVEKLMPDILITDIRMPGCDGLELIQRAKAVSPKLEIVIISGYAQFEYAQTAIRYGVGGYLLKPINKDALMSMLEKLGERCREREDSSVAMESLLIKNQDILQGQLMDELLEGRPIERITELLDREHNFFSGKRLLQVFILKIDCGKAGFETVPLVVIRRKMEEIFEAAVLPLCSFGHLHFQRSAGYGLINYDEQNAEKIRRALRSCLNQLQAQHPLFVPAEISLAASAPTKGAENLPKALHEAQIALSERLVEGNRHFLTATPSASRMETGQLLNKYERLIIHATDSLSVEECKQAVELLNQATQQSENVSGHEIFKLVLSAGRIFVLRARADEEEGLLSRFEEECEVCGSRAQLFEALHRFLTRGIEEMISKKQEETTRPIRMAKQYVQQNYARQITLEDICALTGFSVSYFSTMFKKETGEGFLKYLTHVRIEQAKNLLQDTNLPVTEVCERVGYNDLKHFTATFKKVTSLSPGQYRKLYG